MSGREGQELEGITLLGNQKTKYPDGGMLMITALADVSPLNVLKYSFYMFGLIIATCVTIQFGLMDEKN